MDLQNDLLVAKRDGLIDELLLQLHRNQQDETIIHSLQQLTSSHWKSFILKQLTDQEQSFFEKMKKKQFSSTEETILFLEENYQIQTLQQYSHMSEAIVTSTHCFKQSPINSFSFVIDWVNQTVKEYPDNRYTAKAPILLQFFLQLQDVQKELEFSLQVKYLERLLRVQNMIPLPEK